MKCNFANSPSFIAPERRSNRYGFPRGGEAGAQRLMRGFAQANKNVDYLGAAYCCLTADPHPPLQGTFSSREKAKRALILYTAGLCVLQIVLLFSLHIFYILRYTRLNYHRQSVTLSLGHFPRKVIYNAKKQFISRNRAGRQAAA